VQQRNHHRYLQSSGCRDAVVGIFYGEVSAEAVHPQDCDNFCDDLCVD